jgi:hypothetical protein
MRFGILLRYSRIFRSTLRSAFSEVPMTRLLFAVATIAVYALAISVSAQQPAQGQGRQGGAAQGGRGQAQPAPQNLQVLPRDMTAQQVIPIMQTFAASLGVGCNYCHVTAQDAPARGAGAGRGAAPPAEGQGRGRAAAGPPPMNDFPSDAKQPKKTARTMMLMVRDINSKLGAELAKPAPEVTQVGCVTCHRGVPIPKQLVDIVTEATAAKNATAALDQYRELRKQFLGSAAYDFSDFTLFSAAQRALGAMPPRPDDAIAFLNANVEFNPNSARSYQQMSVAYQRKMDTANAIKMLEKAVELDPMNMGFRNQLNNLKTPPAPGQ